MTRRPKGGGQKDIKTEGRASERSRSDIEGRGSE